MNAPPFSNSIHRGDDMEHEQSRVFFTFPFPLFYAGIAGQSVHPFLSASSEMVSAELK